MPVGCARSILISFNLILWLAGGTLIVLGTWIFVDPSKIHLFHFITSDDLNTDFGYYLAYALLSLGGFIFVSGLCGCCGAIRENRCLLVAYFGLLFLLMCVEVTMAVVTFIYKDHFLSGLEGRLTNGLIHHYGYKNRNEKYLSFSEAVDFAQYKFKCCGIKGDEDYLNSNWRNESKADTEQRNVPLTCCIMHDPGEVEEPWQNPDVKDDLSCQDSKETVHVKARHKQGCIRDIETWFTRETTILITVEISSAALQLSSPAYSIKSKGYTKDHRSTTPSPLDYQSFNLSKLKPTKSYSFGFGNRTAFTVKSDTPPPNKYSVPTTIGNNVPDKKKTGRAFSMQGRRKHNNEKSTTPGPGAYDPVRVDLYKKKEPAVPFTGHRQSPFVPVDPHLPGPSQYNTLNCSIDKIKGTCAPRAPFGIRHSPKKFTVFTQADIMY